MATLKTHGFFLFSLVDGTVQGSLRGATGVQVSSRSDKGDVNGLWDDGNGTVPRKSKETCKRSYPKLQFLQNKIKNTLDFTVL